MSTILKALQRLERDRRDEPDRSLRDEVMASASPAELDSRSRFIPVLIGLVLGATVGGALIWFLASPPPKPVGETEPVAPALPASPSPTQSSPMQPPRPVVARIPEPVMSDLSTPPMASVIPEKLATPPEEVATSLEMSKAEEKIVVRVPAPLPELVVRKTVWHPVASRRVATLSIPPGGPQQEVHEGDFLGSLVVLEITPSSVLFGRDGVELRKRVGE